MPHDMAPASTALVVTSALVPTVVFAPGGVDDILAKVKAEARSVKTDISTVLGRKAVKSLAYMVVRSKTALDDMGKTLGEDMRRQVDAINADRRRIRDELDALAAEVRKPLTDWENAEATRVAEHERLIGELRFDPSCYADQQTTSEGWAVRLAFLERYPARDWQEFAQRASETLAAEIAKTKVALSEAKEREAAAVEAERRRQEEERARAQREAQERREREERIAAEAAERARQDAEAKARAEAEAVEAARQRELAAAEDRRLREVREAEAKAKAEREAAEAATREAERRAARAEADRLAAEQRAAQAAEAERRRIAEEQAREKREVEAREASRNHRRKIHGEARDDLMGKIGALTEEQATAIVIAIARGEIRHAVVTY